MQAEFFFSSSFYINLIACIWNSTNLRLEKDSKKARNRTWRGSKDKARSQQLVSVNGSSGSYLNRVWSVSRKPTQIHAIRIFRDFCNFKVSYESFGLLKKQHCSIQQKWWLNERIAIFITVENYNFISFIVRMFFGSHEFSFSLLLFCCFVSDSCWRHVYFFIIL